MESNCPDRRPPTPRLRIAGLLGVAVLVLIVGAAGFGRKVSERRPDDGVEWVDRDGAGPIATAVRDGGPGRQAGILDGDRLLEIEGLPVGAADRVPAILWEEFGRTRVDYRVQRGDVEIVLAVPVAFPPATPPLYSYLAVVGLFFLFSGFVVFLRLPADRAAVTFFCLCLAQFLLLVYSPTGRAGRFDWVLYWGDQIGRLFAPALILHFALRFPRWIGHRRRFPYILYLPSTLFLAATLHLVGFGAVLRFSDPIGVIRVKDRLELVLAGAYMAAAAGRFLLSYLRARDALHRETLRWVGLGTAVGLLPFSLLYLLPRGFGLPVDGWWELSAFPMLLLPLFLAAAITSRRVVELEFILKRGIRFLSFSFIVIAVFLAASITLTGILKPYLAASDQIGAVLAAVVAAAFVPAVRRLSNSLVDHLFYSSRYDLRRTLKSFARELSAIYDLRHLVDAFTGRIRSSLEVEQVAVFVRDGSGLRFRPVTSTGEGDGEGGLDWSDSPGEDRLRRDFVDLLRIGRPAGPFTLLVPMRVRGRVTALLAARGRGEAGAVDREDRDLLVSLCGQAAGAIESARLYGELQERIGEIDRLRKYSDGILESSRIGILVVGPRGHIRAWNGAMARLYGMERHRAIARPAAEILPRDLLLRAGLTEPGAGREAEPRLARYPLRAADGRRCLVNVTVSRIAAESAGRGGTVLTFDDVTEQIRMQEDLARKERLAAVGLLAAGVAHEVNTPLTGIASYAQMLRQAVDGDHEKRRMLRQIESQAFRASEIANRLLDLARSDGDLQEVVRPTELVRETLSLFQPQVRSRGIRIKTCLEELPEVVGHRGRLQQVLLNLLWNAVDAMREGGTITVTARRCGDEVRIGVGDQGIGIPPENLPRLYDPFFSTKRSRGGTGLGLSVSYGIVEEHGGRMEVESEPGGGTDFRIFLPRMRARQAG